MLMLALLLAAADAPEAPVKIFGDWAVGCDNGKRCELASLPLDEESGEASAAQILIQREAGPTGVTMIELALDKHEAGRIEVHVDGKLIAATNAATADETLALRGADAEAVVRAMVQGQAMVIIGKGGIEWASVSLKGASAASRFSDAAQGRAGTVTAFAATGSKPGSAVPPAPALPHVKAIRPVPLPARTIGKAQVAALIKAAGCDGEDQSGAEIDAARLDKGRTLVLIPCGAGAYNFSTVPMLIGADGKATVAPGFGTDVSLVNAGWDAKTGLLGTFNKGRGVGDCGESETWAWDGGSFVEVEAASMPECRGSMNWITTWRAIAD